MTYEQACNLRFVAERGQDPARYDVAAEAFEELQMSNAAKRCRDRAEYYRVSEKAEVFA